MVLIRGIYVVVYSTIIIGMFRDIIIIIYEVPTCIGPHAADQDLVLLPSWYENQSK